MESNVADNPVPQEITAPLSGERLILRIKPQRQHGAVGLHNLTYVNETGFRAWRPEQCGHLLRDSLVS